MIQSKVYCIIYSGYKCRYYLISFSFLALSAWYCCVLTSSCICNILPSMYCRSARILPFCRSRISIFFSSSILFSLSVATKPRFSANYDYPEWYSRNVPFIICSRAMSSSLISTFFNSSWTSSSSLSFNFLIVTSH